MYIYSKLSFSASLHFSFLSVVLLRLGEKLLKSLMEAYGVHQQKYDHIDEVKSSISKEGLA